VKKYIGEPSTKKRELGGAGQKIKNKKFGGPSRESCTQDAAAAAAAAAH
jgi:hypothetical protein